MIWLDPIFVQSGSTDNFKAHHQSWIARQQTLTNSSPAIAARAISERS